MAAIINIAKSKKKNAIIAQILLIIINQAGFSIILNDLPLVIG